MPSFTPPLEDLPAEIPFFPLKGALMLPGGKLPLNIFEPRFLALVEAALADRRLFGMVLPDPALPRTAIGSGVYRLGCLGRITSFSETDDGRMLITLKGLIRYRILEELPMDRPFRRARVSYAHHAQDLEPPGRPVIDRLALIAALRAYFTARRMEANWAGIEQTDDISLVTSLCMLCPFEAEEQQALLEAPGVTERAAMLIALLRMGALSNAAPSGRAI